MWWIALSLAQPADDESIRDAMADHWSAGTAVRDAVLANDLSAVRAAAKHWQAAAANPEEPVVQRDARRTLAPWFEILASAPDVESAASAVGQLGATCAACHQRHGRTRSYVQPGPPRSRHSMDYHRAGAEWMWAGLVASSQPMFRVGARTLEASLLPAHPGGSVTRQQTALQFESEVRMLATLAHRARTDGERGELFGSLIRACSRCHELTDGGPAHVGRPGGAPVAPVVSEMHEGAQALDRARAAVRRGDLETVRQAASSMLATAPLAGLPSNPWGPWSAEVREQVTRLSKSATLQEGTLRLTDVATVCGSCHAAVGGGPGGRSAPPPGMTPSDPEERLWRSLLSGASVGAAEQTATELREIWSQKATNQESP